jgi:hypothetical protein
MNAYPFARKLLRRTAATAGAVAAGLLILALTRITGRLSVLALLSLVGAALGALCAEVCLRALHRWPAPAFSGLAAIAVSQAAYQLLVWTGWKMDSALWRIWWIAMVASVMTTHVLLLHLAATGTGGKLTRWTSVCAVLSGTVAMALVARPDLLASPGTVYLWMWVVPATGSIAGSLAVTVRWARRRGTSVALPRGARIVALVASHVALFLAGLYLGGMAPEAPHYTDLLPSALAGLPLDTVEAGLKADLDRLRKVSDSLDAVRSKTDAFYRKLRERHAAEDEALYRPGEEDQIRWHFVTYLSQRSALLQMVATYAGFEAVRDPDVRARCFLVGYTAGVVANEAGLYLVHTFGDDAALCAKLNEPEPTWGLPAGQFDRIRHSVTDRRTVQLCREMAVYYRHKKEAWEDAGIWPTATFAWIDARINRGLQYAEQRATSPVRAWMNRAVARVKEDTYSPVYAVQSVVSEWIGDTRIVEEKPLITAAQIHALRPRLRPGDILLERRNWYLSNAFLPGFWPHAALYVGTPDDLRRLKIADHPEVRSRLDAFRAPAADGEPCTVIESVSEGVIFNSLTHSMHADHVAVLRPRLAPGQIAEAIVRAFSYHGKPYDFEFDFFSSDKIVCTELVYRAYDAFLRFDLVPVMGRKTLPAIELVRKFRRERDAGRPELDFVCFLDGDPGAGTAREADAEAFCRSVDRPRAFQE